MSLSKLGDIEFNVVSIETPEYTNTITDRPVEGGVISDNIENQPTIMNIEGYVTGEDAGEKIAALRGYLRKKELVKYVGRNSFKDVAIESFSSEHSVTTANGFSFRMTLKEVRTTKTEIVDIPTPPPVRTQSKPMQNMGARTERVKQVDADRYTARYERYKEQKEDLTAAGGLPARIREA